ncbi:hypothetical protein NDU88_003642 [Pleurodeles waltl]|uniref:Rx N-terminal domain-containing protein n=1 Tax=Pleurodeles waltl TaxID=8319 RepID=A0AAV7MT19_PLEWA|nr:hypothetical protein NDU88_003642 [Pleurodeles waltl]
MKSSSLVEDQAQRKGEMDVKLPLTRSFLEGLCWGIHDEIAVRRAELVNQLQDIKHNMSAMGHRVDDLETAHYESEDELESMGQELLKL